MNALFSSLAEKAVLNTLLYVESIFKGYGRWARAKR